MEWNREPGNKLIYGKLVISNVTKKTQLENEDFVWWIILGNMDIHMKKN